MGSETALLVGEGLRVEQGGRTVLAVDRIALHQRELLVVLGPNGAGKSTLLRALAMLERPSAGEVRYRYLAGRAAEKALRSSSAAVLQRPHFWRDTVAYNLGLGLRLRKLPDSEVEERVGRMAEALDIHDLLRRDVNTLSDGEAQRVALGRALVLQPDLLLLDEPMSGLDPRARAELREDLERLCRERSTAILLATRDRSEAFYLADRIAVLLGGRVVQVGSPTDLYQDPADPWIAGATGTRFCLRGIVRERGEGIVVASVGGTLLRARGDAEPGAEVKVAYRPEDLVLAPAQEPSRRLSARNLFYATVTQVRNVEGAVRLRLAGPPDVVATVTPDAAEDLDLAPEARVSVRVKATALRAHRR